MKFRTWSVISVVLLVLFGAPTLISQSSVQLDSSAIHQQFSQFQETLLVRDTLSIGNFYTDDAVSLLQNQPVKRGRNSIVQRWKRSLSSPILIRVTSSEVNVSSSGQDAFQFGTFEIRAADTTNAFLASGKVMFLWRKHIDRWRIALEMDNFNSAPPQKSPVQKKQ